MIKFRCVHCGADLEDPDEMAGREDTCRLCGRRLVVPLSQEQQTYSSGVPPVLPVSGTGPPGGAVPAAYDPTAVGGGSGMAVAALVLGIFAIVIPVLGIVTGAIAIALGSASLRRPKGKGMAVAGIITGSIGALMSVVAVLVTILVPVVMAGLAQSEVAVCQNNLGVIGRKYNDYAYESEHADAPFPRHINDGDAHDTTAATGLKTANAVNAALGSCGMQTVWVMIDNGHLPDTAFKCPGDAVWTARISIDKYGWADLTEFSYGIHYPYSGNGAGTANPANPNARDATRRLTYRENLVLFADRNPGGAVDGIIRFHTNHPGSDGGCIVVSRIGNTKFHQYSTDSEAGLGDDIYTDERDTARPVPDSETDTVITPQISR